MAAMREFIILMGTRSEQERKDAIKNVMITKAHFDEAVGKVKGSLDHDAIEKSERQAWVMLYNQDQRTILDKALSTLHRAVLGHRKVDEKIISDLQKACHQRKKDFSGITKLTEALEKRMERMEK
jgi:transitional endoplasmic reticulum ATPase